MTRYEIWMNAEIKNMLHIHLKLFGNVFNHIPIGGTCEAYKTVNSMVLVPINSQVTYVIINGAIKISDMWIRNSG